MSTYRKLADFKKGTKLKADDIVIFDVDGQKVEHNVVYGSSQRSYFLNNRRAGNAQIFDLLQKKFGKAVMPDKYEFVDRYGKFVAPVGNDRGDWPWAPDAADQTNLVKVIFQLLESGMAGPEKKSAKTEPKELTSHELVLKVIKLQTRLFEKRYFVPAEKPAKMDARTKRICEAVGGASWSGNRADVINLISAMTDIPKSTLNYFIRRDHETIRLANGQFIALIPLQNHNSHDYLMFDKMKDGLRPMVTIDGNMGIQHKHGRDIHEGNHMDERKAALRLCTDEEIDTFVTEELTARILRRRSIDLVKALIRESEAALAE